MNFKKTYNMIRAVLPFCLLFIFSVVFSLSLDASRKVAAAAPDTVTGRLFRDMGIISIPHIAPPFDFNLSDLNGNMVNLSDFKGKIVFLNFWTTWCPECRAEMPSMQTLYTHFKDKDFAMVAINMNEPSFVVKKYFKDHQLTFTALLDSINELGGPFGIRGIPTTYIIDRDGSIIGIALGRRRWDSKESTALFEHLTRKIEINTNTSEHEKRQGISSDSIISDSGTGHSTDNPAHTD
ncbi:MAG: TlpA disulfide reductase family protein [Desulfobacterales bacterium]